MHSSEFLAEMINNLELCAVFDEIRQCFCDVQVFAGTDTGAVEIAGDGDSIVSSGLPRVVSDRR